MNEKRLQEIIDRAEDEYDRLKDRVHEQYDEIKRLNNIIKEVREYIEKASDNEYSYGDYDIHYEVKKELLEILDKENNDE